MLMRTYVYASAGAAAAKAVGGASASSTPPMLLHAPQARQSMQGGATHR